MPKRTGRPWRRVRDFVIKRDGGICHICGFPGSDSADHIVPASHLPEAQWYNPSNLAAVHHNKGRQCNRVRRDRSVTYARQRLAPSTPPDIGWKW